jgi:hypothetical protein
MTNYEKYFGTPERAAKSMAGDKGFNKDFVSAWNDWLSKDDSLRCPFVGRRNGKTLRKIASFERFLNQEVKDV